MRTASRTVRVPAEAILGEEAVASLRAVPRDVADAAIAELDAAAESLHDEAATDAPAGPSDSDEVDPDELAYPPVFAGLVPQDGEALSATVLRYLSEVPAEWRVEAMEAIYDVLEPATVDPPPRVEERAAQRHAYRTLSQPAPRPRPTPRPFGSPLFWELSPQHDVGALSGTSVNLDSQVGDARALAKGCW
jgi:hypothetical protein